MAASSDIQAITREDLLDHMASLQDNGSGRIIAK
jgi:hypothetical protein